jgi:hypothetical protein
MDMNKHPCRTERGYIWRVVGGETIILTDNARKIHTLNDVAGEIWKLSDGTMTVDDIISKVIEEFDVDVETANRDVIGFISKLCEMNLLELKTNSDSQ